MKLDYKDSAAEIYTNEKGNTAGIIRDNHNKYYQVIARINGEKGKTIATRCTYDMAYKKASEFLS